MYDCAITDRDGNPVRTLRGITVTRHDVDSSSRNIERRFDIQLEQIMNGPAKSTMTPSVAHSFVTNGSSSILPNDSPIVSDPQFGLMRAFRFQVGEEIHLQRMITNIWAEGGRGIGLVAGDGMDGGTALGFSRALRNELAPFHVRLTVFDPTWPESAWYPTLEKLSSQPNLPVKIILDSSGNASVAKLLPSLPPPPTELPNNGFWVLNGRDIVQAAPIPVIPPSYLLVQFSAVYPLHSSLQNFFGTVIDPGSTTPSAQS